MGYKYSNSSVNGLGDMEDIGGGLDDAGIGSAVDLSTVQGATDTVTFSTDGQVLDARDAWASGAALPPAQVVTSSAQAGLFDSIIAQAPALLREVLNYRKQALPGGGYVYTRTTPITANAFGVTSSNYKAMMVAGVAAVVLFAVLGKKK